jgi:hypothetical protein
MYPGGPDGRGTNITGMKLRQSEELEKYYIACQTSEGITKKFYIVKIFLLSVKVQVLYCTYSYNGERYGEVNYKLGD